MNLFQTVNAPQRQQGAALIVALFMLLVISLIAVSSLNTASLEEKMAVNTQNYVRTFQASESAVANVLFDMGLMISAENKGLNPATPATKSITLPNGRSNVNVDLVYAGESNQVFNATWGSGGNYLFFEARANSALANDPNFSSRITQGFYRIVPSNE